jgi:hypothetical protein
MIKLRDILNEVGEATTTPYKWKKVFTKEDTVFFAFKTDQGTSYKVALENYVYEDFKENDKEYPAIEVSFGIIPGAEPNMAGDYTGDMFTVSNKGEMYRVMSTIVNIIKDYIKRNDNIKVIIYEPIKKEGEKGFKRNDLYMAFIKKQIPTAKFEDSYGSVIVKI